MNTEMNTEKKERLQIGDFDCVMVCSMLGLSLDRNLISKLARKFGLISADKEHDPYYGYYVLHKACHCNRKLQEFLQELFDRRYALIRKQLSDGTEAEEGELTKKVRSMFKESPAGVLWTLLTDGNEQLKSLGVYNIHRIMLLGLEKYLAGERSENLLAAGDAGAAEDAPGKTAAENAAQDAAMREKISAQEREISILRKRCAEKDSRIFALGEKLGSFEKRPDSEGKLKRQIRMLQYELEQRRGGESAPRQAPAAGCVFPEENDGACGGSRIIIEDERSFCENAAREICRLDRLKVAVVGGIERLIPRYQEVVEKMGGRFIAHTGNCSGNGSRKLANVVCQAEIVVYITSINSHNALNVVQATCRRSGRSFCVLRSASPDALERLLKEKANVRSLCCENSQLKEKTY